MCNCTPFFDVKWGFNEKTTRDKKRLSYSSTLLISLKHKSYLFKGLNTTFVCGLDETRELTFK